MIQEIFEKLKLYKVLTSVIYVLITEQEFFFTYRKNNFKSRVLKWTLPNLQQQNCLFFLPFDWKIFTVKKSFKYVCFFCSYLAFSALFWGIICAFFESTHTRICRAFEEGCLNWLATYFEWRDECWDLLNGIIKLYNIIYAFNGNRETNAA